MAVVGGGPAGLMAAEVLATAGARVVVYERNRALGRKFLLAGRGGLNLTHSEELGKFLSRYRDASPSLLAAIRAFDPTALRAWADGLGADTFVGSSGRVFPAALRAAPLLRAWIARLQGLGVESRLQHRWTGWADTDGTTDAVVLTMGGASWPRTGSDGSWSDTLAAGAVGVAPLRASNAGFLVEWTDEFRERFGGTPMKDVALSVAGDTSRGDVMVSNAGIEGGAVYALSSVLRENIERDGYAIVSIDLRPNEAVTALVERLSNRRTKESTASWLHRAGWSPVATSLLREVTGNAIPNDTTSLAQLTKAVSLRLVGMQPLDRAISTAGGVRFSEIDDGFMLRARPGTFVAGEMLDWDAPTGGYLLQACMSTGVAAARAECSLGYLKC